METENFAIPAHTVQTLVFASLAFAILAYLPQLNYRLKLAKLPVFGGGGVTGEKQRQLYLRFAKRIYTDGYRKFKDTVYRIASGDDDDIVVVHPSMLSELRKLPDDVLSFPGAVESLLQTKYTKLLANPVFLSHSVTADLTPALVRMNAVVCEEIEISMKHNFPRCEDSTRVRIYEILATIIAQVSGRVFVGPELCRNPKYIESSVKYTLEAVEGGDAIRRLRPWLRRILGPHLPEIKRLRARERSMRECLEPVFRQRKEAEKSDPNWQKPDDMLQWMMDRSDSHNAATDLDTLMRRQLLLTFAAIHTTAMTTTNVVYTLAATPEYIPELREEARSVLAENNGVLTSRALQQMVKLDSYMREVNRLYPPGLTVFNRRVLKSFTLSNGQYIPAGVFLDTPSFLGYHGSEPSPDEEQFDGFRHYKQRLNASKASEVARTQFVAANEQNLSFGFGNHACPGRFFAANEIKMIITKLILEYDIGMPDGRKERYAQLELGHQTGPDATKELVLKRVQE